MELKEEMSVRAVYRPASGSVILYQKKEPHTRAMQAKASCDSSFREIPVISIFSFCTIK